MRRRGWKRGDWLVKDEESGFTVYASQCTRDYYGVYKLKSQADQRHPQEYILAKRDPYPVSPTSPPLRTYDTSAYVQGTYVGSTTVLAPFGAATHLYNQAAVAGTNYGIGLMTIGTDFVVR